MAWGALFLLLSARLLESHILSINWALLAFILALEYVTLLHFGIHGFCVVYIVKEREAPKRDDICFITDMSATKR